MKLNVHLECFSMRKDLLTEKTKCQVLLCQKYWWKCGNKQNHPVKVDSLFTWKRSYRFFSNIAYKLRRQSAQLFPYVCDWVFVRISPREAKKIFVSQTSTNGPCNLCTYWSENKLKMLKKKKKKKKKTWISQEKLTKSLISITTFWKISSDIRAPRSIDLLVVTYFVLIMSVSFN